jgi:hypothetical protein
MSAYASHPDVPRAHIRPYPKHRQTLRTSSESSLVFLTHGPTIPLDDVCYGDFFVPPEEALAS